LKVRSGLAKLPPVASAPPMGDKKPVNPRAARVTLNEQVLTFPLASVAVPLSVVVPTGKLAPDSEQSDSLVKILRELPPDYRTVLQLYRIEQRPLAEVAVRMNRTQGATCQLIARAMAMLRDALREE